MADQPPRKSVIPGWSGSADGAEGDSAAASRPRSPQRRRPESAAGAKSQRRRKRGPLFDVPPPPDYSAELGLTGVPTEREKKTVWERIKSLIHDFVSGVWVSLAIHAVVLFAFAFIVYTARQGQELVLQASWLSETPNAGQQRGGEGEGDDVGPLMVTANAGDVKSVQNPKETDDDNPQGEAVEIDLPEVGRMVSDRAKRRRVNPDEMGDKSEQARKAIGLGLSWLARQQQGDGSWKMHEGYPDAGQYFLRTDTGATALALLCFMGDGNTHLSGDYAENVRKGLDWILGIQKANGDLHDFSERGRNTAYYAHALGTIAISEALAMTGDARFQEPAERAVKWLVVSQQPLKGGWKYQPQDQFSEGDLSVTSWCLMALHVARSAGVDVPKEAFLLGMSFLNRVEEENGAKYKYEADDAATKVTRGMTAAGLLSRQYLGWPREHPAFQKGMTYLASESNPVAWDEGRRNVYEWYYITDFMHNMGGDPWRTWYARVQQPIFDKQHRKGSLNLQGSWSPFVSRDGIGKSAGLNYGHADEHARQGGRLYITCLCLLTLEAPYRYASIYD